MILSQIMGNSSKKDMGYNKELEEVSLYLDSYPPIPMRHLCDTETPYMFCVYNDNITHK